MVHRLRKIGLAVERQKPLQVRDEDGTVLGDYFADLFVENQNTMLDTALEISASAMEDMPTNPIPHE